MVCSPMRQILSTLLLLSAPILSQATYAGTALPLYDAEYRTKVSGIRITLTRSLTEEQGHYHLQQSGKAFLVKLKEESHFTIDGDQILGEHFHYQLNEKGFARLLQMVVALFLRERARQCDPDA